MNDKTFDFRKIFEGMMSYLYLTSGWWFLVPGPVLVLSSPSWWFRLPLSVRNEIGIDSSTISIYWLIGIAVISVALGFFLRGLAFGILSENRFRIIICASLSALFGLVSLGLTAIWIAIFYFDQDSFDLSSAVMHGVFATSQFLIVAGFLWLIYSKKKN
ncbi:hypothetical protein C8R32_12318 [Nitrosospira sp. Nsp5]|uniref:DUF4345 domain-containing protein n=1 Tax=Nitrosospira multiformis TaxID=1231 RepID=A0ABY0TDG6_9PROT|nr:hypothetical protein C8R32_12318 [Nitrosospira sp. Nsp5]SDQ66533.1 hypothetical protein SAMN05216402_1761 [Nitrosospira multiformis]